MHSIQDLAALNAKAALKSRRSAALSGKKNKYKNKFCTVAGVKFRSMAEGKLYPELLLMERGGAITDLHVQKRWPIRVNDQLIGHYTDDFGYTQQGRQVVIDVKGRQTLLSKWKIKLMKACHDIDVRLMTPKTDPRLFKK